MRAVRITLAAAVTFGALVIPQIATGADASQATLPPALSKVSSIERIYPDLYQREAARKAGRSWERLRTQARTRWMRTHPCAPATLHRRYILSGPSMPGYWQAVEATWACLGMPPAKRTFLRCIPAHEGGYAYPDVRYGGGRGYPGQRPGEASNVVFGPWQVRPGWVNGHMGGRPGTYASDEWTPAAYRYALHPVNMARIVAHIGNDQYATQGRCS